MFENIRRAYNMEENVWTTSALLLKDIAIVWIEEV